MEQPTGDEAAEPRVAAERLLRRYWPKQTLILLLQVALASEDRARSAWAEWNTLANLDDASWPEVRLLAALLERLNDLDPASPILPRLSGIRRFMFANSHRTLTAVRPMLAALRAAGIEIMLLKGAARLALEPSAASKRYVSDIDILVRQEQWTQALDVARAQRWRVQETNKLLGGNTLESRFALEHAINFFPADPKSVGALDLHHFARYMCRNIGDDERLWRGTRPANFLGVDCLLPSPANLAAVGLTHAARYAKDDSGTADWALDLMPVLKAKGFDWAGLVRETRMSQTEGFVASPLLMLQKRLALRVPAAVMDELLASFVSPFTGEFRHLSTAYLGQMKGVPYTLAARDAAVLRAQRAVSRPGAPKLRRALLRRWPQIVVPGVLERETMVAIDLPEGLSPGEQIGLEIRFRVNSAESRPRLVVQAPHLVLDVWQPQEGQESAALGLQQLRFKLPAPLLVMGGMKAVGFRWMGSEPISELSVNWMRPRPEADVRRGLRGLISRATRMRKNSLQA